MTPSPGFAKSVGAFYTDARIADFLVWWAVRSSQETVMDPSFGEGVFLRAACSTLSELGGRPATQVHGVELDTRVHAAISVRLASEFGLRPRNLLNCDFFSIDPRSYPPMDAVVGNPPFIRYQKFCGTARSKALARAREGGVQLKELTSSWAPFLVHSVALLRQGGRLAMVVPQEISHADYALPVLDFLSKSFRSVTFLTFRKRLFPELNEATLLLLAEGKALCASQFLWRDLAHAGILRELQNRLERSIVRTRRVDAQALASGRQRLIEYFVPPKTRELYRELKYSFSVCRLGEFADVGIGYVTGANEFFHLSPEEARRWEIPEKYLRPAVRRGRSLSGLRFTQADWHSAVSSSDAGYLLHIPLDGDLPDGLRRYLRWGESQGIPKAYKCRTRTPWYCVPHVHRPDALLTYMSGSKPRLVANEAGVVAPNTLHILRFHPHSSATCKELSVLWLTSLTRLSVEIEGHPLGGGMLKLEPTEAEAVLVASSLPNSGLPAGLARELDCLVRAGKEETAQEIADHAILADQLGLSRRDCALLRTAADNLRTRRCVKDL